MLARSVFSDTAHILSRSMRHIPAEPIVSRSFSRYAKFDGEEHNTYITRAQELRNADNNAWRKELALRTKCNDDWDTFQAKYFQKPKVTDNSYESSNRSISSSGGGSPSQSSGNTSSFMAGYLTRDVTDLLSSKSKTNTDTSSTSSESTALSSGNSSHSSGTSDDSYSSGGYSSDWGSGDGGDSGGGGSSDD